MMEDAVKSHWFCKPWKFFMRTLGDMEKLLTGSVLRILASMPSSLLPQVFFVGLVEYHCYTRKRSMLPELRVSSSLGFKCACSMDFCLCNIWAEPAQLKLAYIGNAHNGG